MRRRIKRKARRWTPRQKTWLFRGIVLCLILLTIICLADAKIRPMMRSLAVNQAKITAINAINDEVSQVMQSLQADSEGFLHINRDETGQIISMETDAAKINTIKAEVNLAVSERLNTIGRQTVEIPSGSLSGISMFYGRGMKWKIKLTMSGNVNCGITEDFSSAGINQTLYRVLLTLKADIFIILPGYDTSQTVQTDFVISQTVVVGDIPKLYAGNSQAQLPQK